jgi:hypothetical protein
VTTKGYCSDISTDVLVEESFIQDEKPFEKMEGVNFVMAKREEKRWKNCSKLFQTDIGM